MNDLKKTYEQILFIHQILTQRTKYYLDEVDIAKDSAKTITDMANKLAEQIQNTPPSETAPESTEVQNEQA